MHAVADNAVSMDNNIIRSDILPHDKMEAEGAAEEVKKCLGWILNTRSLQVKLPLHKAIA